MYYDEQSNSIDEMGSMRLEDRDSRLMIRFAGEKRKNDSPYTDDPKRTVTETIVFDKNSQSSHDQIDAYAKLMILIRTYRDELGSFVLNPEVKDGFKFEDGKNKHDYSIRFSPDEAKLIVVSNETGRPVPTVREAVDWQDTFQSFFNIGESKGVNFGYWKDKKLTTYPDRFKYEGKYNLKPKNGDVTTGLNYNTFDTKTISDSQAKQIIHEYFKELTEYGLGVPFQLNPLIDTKQGSKIDKKFYFGNPSGERYLILRTITNNKHQNLSSSKNEAKLKNVRWAATLDSLLAGLERLQQLEFEDQSGLNENKKSEIRRSLKTFNEVINDLGLSIQEPMGRGLKSRLKGRGLRGAGTKSQYQRVERRGKYYNLNDIRGTGLASAYIYQPIGSKYIRIPDLEMGKLNIVYPSRNKLGPIREISPELVKMLKKLLYENDIQQSDYDALTTDDQKLFKDILAATHVQHAFKDTLPDPLENLKAEFDKLKGELLLGNDNPSVIKQLKVITVDMYANKLISDKEFKELITRLI